MNPFIAVLLLFLITPIIGCTQDPKDAYGSTGYTLYYDFHLIKPIDKADLATIWRNLKAHKDTKFAPVDPFNLATESFVAVMRCGSWNFPLKRDEFVERPDGKWITYKTTASIKSDVPLALGWWEAFWVTGKDGDAILIFTKDDEWYDVTKVVRIVSTKIEVFPIFHTFK
jgi:hypothetical protein